MATGTRTPILLALTAAALFGASVPLAQSPARRRPAGDARRAPVHRRRHGRDRGEDRPRPEHGRVPARPPGLPLARRDHARGRFPRARAADARPLLDAGRDRVPAVEHGGRLHGPDCGRVLLGGDWPARLGRDRPDHGRRDDPLVRPGRQPRALPRRARAWSAPAPSGASTTTAPARSPPRTRSRSGP